MLMVLIAGEVAKDGGDGGLLWLAIPILLCAGIGYLLVKLFRKIGRHVPKNIQRFGLVESVQGAFSNYANFNGRTSRSEYWWLVLFSLVAQAATNAFSEALGGLASLTLFLPLISAGVRRMHDSNKRGWWILFPVVNIVLLLRSGDSGENRFGRSPRDNTQNPQAGSAVADRPLQPSPMQKSSQPPEPKPRLEAPKDSEILRQMREFEDENTRLSAELGAILTLLSEDPNRADADALKAEQATLMSQRTQLSIDEINWRAKPEHRHVVSERTPGRELIRRGEEAFERALARRRQEG